MVFTMTQNENLLTFSAKKLLSKIRNKTLSSEEIVKTFLDRIKAVNPILNAVVEQKEEQAILLAQEADKKIDSGETLGKLHGLPVTIKDFCEVKDYTCTYGTEGYRSRIAPLTAHCAQKLFDEGAIMIGLTNCPEFAGAYETSNVLYGPTNNPYDISRSPGGSSGGEAAIIAANGSPLGLGSDGGGSIRLPGHFCGITGIKPTQGLLSAHGIASPFKGIGLLHRHGTFGPMARYVEDLELSLPILAGYDPHDPGSIPVNLPNFDKKQKKRIGIFTHNGIANTDQEIINSINKVADYLSHEGHFVEEVSPPSIERTFDLFWKFFYRKGDFGKSFYDAFEEVGTEDISSLQRMALKDARKVSFDINELYKGIEQIAKFRWDMNDFMSRYDILLCPPCATTAKKHNTSFQNIMDYTYTMTFSLLGWPAGVVRCDYSSERLPIGIQVISKPWQDNLVIDIMKEIERQFGGFIPPEII
tara:strand:- start:1141 stop:2559 length:1419 start_codon:yes stop_codon:yes gene_type:complete